MKPRNRSSRIHKPRAPAPRIQAPDTVAPGSRTRLRQAWLKAFVWVFIAIFLLGSVGAAALIALH